MVRRAQAPAYVLGVGMTKFVKPRGKIDYSVSSIACKSKNVRLAAYC